MVGDVRLLSEKEVAKILKVDRSTLVRWRRSRSGPAFTKVGDRLVRYPEDQLLIWLRDRTTCSWDAPRVGAEV